MIRGLDIKMLDMPNPTPEEILEEGFNLPDFIAKQLRKPHRVIGDEVLELLDSEDSVKPTEIDLIRNKYDSDVERITWRYKEDLQLGKQANPKYTEMLIEITKQYLEELKKYELLRKRQELLEQEQQQLREIELDNLKQLEKKQRQKERIRKYLAGEIELFDLHFDDLMHVKIDPETRRVLETLKRRIINVDFSQSKLLEEKFETMTIGELGREYVKGRKR